MPFSPPSAGALLRLPGKLLPVRLHSRGLTLILNRLLADPIANGELDFLQDRVLRIEVMDLALDYRLTLRNGKLAAAPRGAQEDVRFGGDAREFLLLALNEEDPDTLFFQRRLQLEGDTELGLEIKNLLYSLEEDLLPDPLHRIASQFSRLLGRPGEPQTLGDS
ncbi:ubiquinone anaerobic biosynthesis accessory factor UbiT [Thiolapillus sp.]